MSRGFSAFGVLVVFLFRLLRVFRVSRSFVVFRFLLVLNLFRSKTSEAATLRTKPGA